MLIAARSNVTIENVCEVLKEKFKVKVAGESNKFIRFFIERKENELFLYQSEFIDHLLC